jgi:hypothetical protein
MKKYYLLLLLLFTSTSCDAKITGTVVDAETVKPIEGAVVLVEWTTQKGLPGLSYTSSYKVVEKVTDAEGKFEVSGVLNPLADDPNITVYKKGYVAWNNEFIFPDYSKRTDFTLNDGYTYEMVKFEEEYSHDRHESFFMTCIRSGLNFESKKKIFDAFEWESDLARKERMKKKRAESASGKDK